jgi:ATP/ADP translocase
MIFDIAFKVFEPYQGSISQDNEQYTAMQGIIHFIGWTIAIIILVYVFKYMKKHVQEDERMKKYLEQQEKNKETDTQN